MAKRIKDKYAWGKFIQSFKHIDTYQAHISTTMPSYGEPAKRPSITLTFKSQYMAKIFLYWVTVLGGTDNYEAVVYLEDVVPEVYEGVE